MGLSRELRDMFFRYRKHAPRVEHNRYQPGANYAGGGDLSGRPQLPAGTLSEEYDPWQNSGYLGSRRYNTLPDYSDQSDTTALSGRHGPRQTTGFGHMDPTGCDAETPQELDEVASSSPTALQEIKQAIDDVLASSVPLPIDHDVRFGPIGHGCALQVRTLHVEMHAMVTAVTTFSG